MSVLILIITALNSFGYLNLVDVLAAIDKEGE